MYMRLVQMNVSPDKTPDLYDFYQKKVIPALHKVQGCMFAGLMRSDDRPGECVSLTLWETQASAEAYGSGELYKALIQEVKGFLADSAEWKIQLSKEFTVEYVPIAEEPVVKSYAVGALKDGSISSREKPQLMYVRFVAPKIRPGMVEEFREIYTKEVIPGLQSVKGCRYAYLTEGTKGGDVLSITVWDSKQEATVYEKSSLYQSFNEKLRHTFSELYQWKIGLENDRAKKVVTSDDTSVRHYQVVTGEGFSG
jgi:quinol monooxygenase YgiN